MIPRPEHPHPQCERAEWINLNGKWEFCLDSGVSGMARRLYEQEHLEGRILVPFCPESRLSGVENRDFLNCVWYRRDVTVPEGWHGGRVLLHFGAVDHEAHIFLNGKEVGTHLGGYASFTVDLTGHIRAGVNSLCVCAIDDDRNPLFGHGKQSREYHSHRCYYTRVTGIWQTVWLEHVPEVYIKSFRLFPDPENSALTLEAELCGGGDLTAEAFYEGKPVGTLRLRSAHGGTVIGTMALSELHLWEVGNGRLYDLSLTYGDDRVSSYFGMRSLALDGYRFLINGKSVFQRLVLDQGYYPDGVYTAPSEEALIRDIRISQEAGFNGARLHQKVFEPRFLYHCDRMGYLVWGEYGNWGIDYSDISALPAFLSEWREVLKRDFNHPSIVGWAPLNETWDYDGRKQDDRLLVSLYEQTKAYDPTRPCIDTSGAYHVKTDIYDLHDYIQSPEKFEQIFALPTPEQITGEFRNHHVKSVLHQGDYRHGQPFFVSEYGGIKWDVNSGLSEAWGYGDAPHSIEEFRERYRGLTDILLDNPCMFGFCYTQLYDVEQETNGLYTYDRTPKCDVSFFREVNRRKAAIED